MAKQKSKKGRAKGTGTLFQQKTGRNYYLQYKINGKRKTVSLKVKHKEDKIVKGTRIKGAETLAKEIMEPAQNAKTKEQVQLHIAEERKIIKRSRVRIDEAWDLFVRNPQRPDSGEHTLKQYKSKWKNNFVPWLKDNCPEIQYLAEITDEVAIAFAESIWNEGISERTYNGYLQALRLIIRILSKQAGITENPFLPITNKQENKLSRKELTEKQVMKLFKAFDDPELKLMHKDEMLVMFHIGCWTGSRAHDAATMKWENVDFKNGTIRFSPKKTAKRTGKVVTIPMHPLLRKTLGKAKEWETNDFILPNIAKRYSYNSGGVGKDVMKVFEYIELETTKKADSRRKLKQNVYSFHSFRHSFVSFCANAGVPLSVVQEIVGHGNPAMTRHYTHTSKEAAEGAINALPMTPQNQLQDKKSKIISLLDNASEEQLNEVLEIFKQ